MTVHGYSDLECIWFSPHCLGKQTSLFDMAA